MASRKSIKIGRSDRFIADTHFGHMLMAGRREQRLPRDVSHDEYLIDCWNAVVGPGDTVWHLGDFAWSDVSQAGMQAIFDRLNGRKHLLLGNHDEPAVERLGWESVLRGPVHWLDSDSGLRIIGNHWPLREWDGWWRGSLHFHGHTHANLPNSRRSMDVGIDSIGFFPATFSEIHTRMQPLPELDFSGVVTTPFEVKP